MFALQFARAAGARVIVTSSSDEKLARARALGADAGINYRDVDDWASRVLEITDGRGVDVVVEVGGSGTLDQAVSATRHGGEVALVGVLTGFGGPVNTAAILFKAINLRGVYVGSVADLRAALRAGVRPIVDAVFPFEEAEAAFAHLKGGRHIGKVAISITS